MTSSVSCFRRCGSSARLREQYLRGSYRVAKLSGVCLNWVAPQGRGKAPDVIFTLKRRFTDARDYESSLAVSFSSPADGIQPWDNTADYHSALKLPRLAPENGYVQPLVLSNRRLPGSFVERDVKEERNYFFRVRTVLDQQGKVVSALYGKIDGDIRFSPIRSKTRTAWTRVQPRGSSSSLSAYWV